MIVFANITSVLGSLYHMIQFSVFRLLFWNGSFKKFKILNILGIKHSLLFDYCSNDFCKRSIFCSVGVELDNFMDIYTLALKSMIISDPP